MKTRILIPPGLWCREMPATNAVVPSEYMKKTLTLVKICFTNYPLVQPSTSSQKISHCSVISLYIGYMHIHWNFSKSHQYKKTTISLPSKHPNLSLQLPFSTAVSPWGALMQSIKGMPLHLGIGAITPVKASCRGCQCWLFEVVVMVCKNHRVVRF